MSSTSATVDQDQDQDNDVASCYNEQKELEEEEERQLLAKEPGDEDGEVPPPSILDVSMEDAPPGGATAPANTPNPIEGGSVAPANIDKPNPIEGGKGSVPRIDTDSANPTEGIPNPIMGGGDINNHTNNEGAPNLASNKLNLYLSAKNVSNPNVLPNLFGDGSTTLLECGSFLAGGGGG
jgi:hypothetical protein